MGILLLVILLLLIIGAAPWHPYSRPYGYYPSGALMAVLLIVVLLLVLGVL